LRDRDIETSAVADRGWGLLIEVTLPGGGKLGIYEPRHPSPPRGAPRRRRTLAKKKPVKRTQARAPRRSARRTRNGSAPRGRARS